jgi:AcrR family transcriptional regulator
VTAAAAPAGPARRSGRGRRGGRPSGDDRERDILVTAERLLGERSFHEISVDDLARGAGISRPTFYFYFPSSEAVVLTLLDRLVEEARATRHAALERAGDDAPELWRQGLRAIHDTFEAHRALAVAAAQLMAESGEARKVWGRVMEGFVADTAAAIDAERACGAAPPGPPARELAIALSWMNERVFLAGFAHQEPALDAASALDTLFTIWGRAVYGDDRLADAGT